MTEETLVCPNCRREVPRTIYCIYCGAVLKSEARPKPPKVETPVEEPTKEVKVQDVLKEEPKPAMEPEVIKPAMEPEVMKPVIEPEVIKPPLQPPIVNVPDAGVEPEVANLIQEFSKYFVWKARLLGMLLAKGITEPVFVKVFTEYKEKLAPLTQDRAEKLNSYNGQLLEKQGFLANSKFRLEELEVRHEVGQIEHAEFQSVAPGLETEIAATEKDIRHINAQLACLADVPEGKSLLEIRELNNLAEKCYQKLPDLVETGRLSRETEQMLMDDSENVLTVFQSRIGHLKKQEKDLNEELTMLENRSRSGDLPNQAFEKTKKEILDKIESIWG